MFYRHELVTLLFRDLHGFLKHPVGILGKICLPSAHLWVVLQYGIQGPFDRLPVQCGFLKQISYDVPGCVKQAL